jgi:hypothetical protein
MGQFRADVHMSRASPPIAGMNRVTKSFGNKLTYNSTLKCHFAFLDVYQSRYYKSFIPVDLHGQPHMKRPLVSECRII